MNSAFIGYGEGECYPPRLKAEVDNTLRDLLNSSYPNQPHSLLAKGVRDEVLQIWTSRSLFSMYWCNNPKSTRGEVIILSRG